MTKRKGKEKKRKGSQKVKNLLKGIRKNHKRLLAIKRTTIRQATKIGRDLNKVKRLVEKKKGRKWLKYLKAKLPDISKRRMQRYMRLGRVIKLDKCPALELLSQNQLHELISIVGKKSVKSFLKSEKIKADFDVDNSNKVKTFKKKIKNLLASHRKTKGSAESKAWEEAPENEDEDENENEKYEKKKKSKGRKNPLKAYDKWLIGCFGKKLKSFEIKKIKKNIGIANEVLDEQDEFLYR